MSGEHVGLVAGTLGVVGRAAIMHIAGLDGWRAIGLSRRMPDFELDAEFLSVDLTDPADCEAKLSGLSEVTHVFYAAYAPAATLAEETVLNKAMFVNLMQALEPHVPGLRHVQIVQGSKWYGNHLGPYKKPAKEGDPPHMPPNFYFDQQNWLVEQRKGKRWTWSALRPHGICGLAIGSSMNQLTAMAIYASISKHLGLPLRFPGTPGAFNAVYQMTEADYPSPAAWRGRRRTRPARTRPLTSPTANSSAGAICGRRLPASSTPNQARCRPSPLPISWRTRSRSGRRSESDMASSPTHWPS